MQADRSAEVRRVRNAFPIWSVFPSHDRQGMVSRGDFCSTPHQLQDSFPAASRKSGSQRHSGIDDRILHPVAHEPRTQPCAQRNGCLATAFRSSENSTYPGTPPPPSSYCPSVYGSVRPRLVASAKGGIRVPPQAHGQAPCAASERRGGAMPEQGPERRCVNAPTHAMFRTFSIAPTTRANSARSEASCFRPAAVKVQ
jgi:hypothetical protein